MTTMEEGESTSAEEIPAGNPDELTKNPTALKEAHEEMATLDVHVCGQCHSAFHFVDEFKEHKDGGSCTGKSPVRDSNESKAQVWAFLLWKCSSVRDGSTSNADNSWKLYQQWCRMPEAQRTAWITAGANVQALSKFAHAKVMELKAEDQLVPVQTPAETQVRRRGRPRKLNKIEDIETQPSGEESDEVKASPAMKILVNKLPLSTTVTKKDLSTDSVRNAQERVPPEDRIARRSEREGGTGAEAGEYVVEKILAKRFNPRRKHYEYLLKWEGYPHEQNTWEPVENMETCKHLLEAFEKQLARQKELKALRAQQQQQQQHPVQVKQISTPQPQVVKQIVKKSESKPALTPTGRLQRTSKARALDQVKAWCGGEDEPASKRIKREVSSDEDYSDADSTNADSKPVNSVSEVTEKRIMNGQQSPKSNIDPELVKSLGLGGKGMPNIKGVIKVDPKHMPNLSTGVYIMSKSSGIMKIDSPGKLGPGLNIDQDIIRKQILAAKQKKIEEAKKQSSVTTQSPIRKSYGSSGQHVTEKTIITPSGQKIIQRTIQRTFGSSQQSEGKSPVTILNKKLAQGDSLLRGSSPRGGGGMRGRGRGYSVATSAGNIVRIREKSVPIEFDKWEASSDSSDGVEDPFPRDLGPLPSPSPDRELTLCPLTGQRLARAEGEPTPPPTPPPQPPATPPPETHHGTMLMKVEMSPGGTTGMLIQGDGAQPSLPVLTDEDGTEVKVEASVKQLLESGVDVDDGEEVGLQLHSAHPPIMIRGEDGVLYQVAGENEDGQTLLVAAEGVEGAVEGADGESDGVMYVTREDGQTLLVATQGVDGSVQGVEGGVDGDGEGVTYVTREDGQDVLSIDPAQLAQLMPGGEPGALQQVAVQVEGEPGEDATQVIAQLVQADLPSPGGTRRVVLLLPDGSFTMTELDKEQYESITEASKAQE
ncbi:uncharacterized protein LOC120628522 isoform X1 [Pararge aegeria]|uniref:uncharacterized protein LOC120628522 isoform X1 n=1 Tax=Pararge aegeria TaxID=116150 RepID=UPI0019D00296|nr:uncharacterized protein LOC120628522 isoform X1 [Pararge aegeria]XP_039752836.1 uncharacterized protein LOC120628522 isoform X1 [Pararge aegeria]